MYITGIAAFVLFFINDYNDWKLKKKWLKGCFALGAVLLAVSTVWMCLRGDGHVMLSDCPGFIVWVLCAAALAGQVYSLFFSFDCSQAYSGNGNPEGSDKRYPVTTKMYALCRHPGVLFFILLYVGLVPVTRMSPAGAAVLCALNVALIVFEDLQVFPAIFEDYDSYRKNTPFLIPNRTSIINCISDFRRKL